LYDATSCSFSQYSAILSSSCVPVSVIQEVFYLVQIIFDSINLQINHQFIVDD